MSKLYSTLNTIGELILACFGVLLFLASLYLYNIHLDIESAMEGICDSGEIFVSVLTYEDCNEAKQMSNSFRMWSFGCGFFGLIIMYGAHSSYTASEEAKKARTQEHVGPMNNEKLPNVNVSPLPNVNVSPLPNVNVELPQEGVTDKFSEIERLGELKDKGLLTEEEFQAEKSKLLK